jgi:hypothetical protein
MYLALSSLRSNFVYLARIGSPPGRGSHLTSAASLLRFIFNSSDQRLQPSCRAPFHCSLWTFALTRPGQIVLSICSATDDDHKKVAPSCRGPSPRTEKSAIPCRDGCPVQVMPSPWSAKNLSRRNSRGIRVYIRMAEPGCFTTLRWFGLGSPCSSHVYLKDRRKVDPG